MGFLGSNLLQKGGSKIFQPFKATVKLLCSTSTYYNSVTGLSVSDPFTGDPLAPTTGFTQFRNDYAKWDGAGDAIDLKTSGYSEEFCFIMRETVKNSSLVAEIDFNGGTVQISYEYINTRFAFRVTTANTNTVNYSGYQQAPSNKEYCVKFWDDITDPDTARENYWELYDETGAVVWSYNFPVDWSGNADGIVTNYFLASKSPDVSETDLDLNFHKSSNFGDGDWNTRFKGENEADRDKIVYSTGYKFQMFDDSELGMLYPYIGGANACYLADDRYLIDGTCVTVPAGYELQTINGIYQKINGEYQIIESA